MQLLIAQSESHCRLKATPKIPYHWLRSIVIWAWSKIPMVLYCKWMQIDFMVMFNDFYPHREPQLIDKPVGFGDESPPDQPSRCQDMPRLCLNSSRQDISLKTDHCLVVILATRWCACSVRIEESNLIETYIYWNHMTSCSPTELSLARHAGAMTLWQRPNAQLMLCTWLKRWQLGWRLFCWLFQTWWLRMTGTVHDLFWLRPVFGRLLVLKPRSASLLKRTGRWEASRRGPASDGKQTVQPQ